MKSLPALLGYILITTIFSPCPTFREASVNQNHCTSDSVSQRGTSLLEKINFSFYRKVGGCFLKLFRGVIVKKDTLYTYSVSVPNSSDELIFVKRLAFLSKNTGATTGETQVFVILSSFCDLVQFHSVVDLFAK